MSYTQEQKRVAVEYACKNGVMVASQELNISVSAIRVWAKYFGVDLPKSSTQPMYTTLQKIEILEYARIHGRDAAMKKFGVSKSSIYLWNERMGILDKTPRMQDTREQKIEIVTYARDFGPNAANRKYKVSTSYIKAWNQELKIYEPGQGARTKRKPSRYYSESEKVERLEYARIHGILAAERRYCIKSCTMRKWNEIYNILPASKTARKFTVEQKREILEYAKRHGIEKAARKYQVRPDRISVWNASLHVYNTRAKRVYTAEYRDFVVNYSIQNGIPAAVKKFNIVHSLITGWIQKANLRARG